MYLTNTPQWLQRLFRSVVFSGPSHIEGKPQLYLTFDDGPTPDITLRTIGVLRDHNAKATFFCLGKQAEQHPEILDAIISDGHTIGNHGYEHLDAVKTKKGAYLKNVTKADTLTSNALFRPPYGRLTWATYRALKRRYRLVLFSIMPGDFDQNVSVEDVVKRVVDNIKPGSIVVLHDNTKAGSKMLEALPHILQWATKHGYQCAAL